MARKLARGSAITCFNNSEQIARSFIKTKISTQKFYFVLVRTVFVSWIMASRASEGGKAATASIARLQ
jgi:hypothetical protein